MSERYSKKTLIKHLLNGYSLNPQNKALDHTPQIKMPIYIFYHIYCGSNRFMEIFDEQMHLLRASGLLDVTDHIYVTIIGTDEQRKSVKAKLPAEKTVTVHESIDGSCFEFPCLRHMQQIARDGRDFYALYIHAKGSSISRESYDSKRGSFRGACRNIDLWRQLLGYFLIEKWHIAINALNNGYMYYSALLKHLQPAWQQTPHYSGNLWWATAEGVRKARDIDNEFMRDRYNAEFWVVADASKAYNAFHYPCSLYNVPVPRRVYTRSRLHPANIWFMIRHYIKLPTLIASTRYDI